jgi:hypothetical protein
MDDSLDKRLSVMLQCPQGLLMRVLLLEDTDSVLVDAKKVRKVCYFGEWVANLLFLLVGWQKE